MAFIVGGALVGIAVIWDDHSNHRNHNRYREYGDSELRNQISNMESRVGSKEADIQRLKNEMEEDYRNRINQLKNEKNYSGLNNSDVLSAVKTDMKRELENEISRDRQELSEIDKMISRINELELQANEKKIDGKSKSSDVSSKWGKNFPYQ